MNRRDWLRSATLAAAGLMLPGGLLTQQARRTLPELVIYKDPGCGCCDLWVDHVRAHGFRVRLFDTRRLDEVKANLGLPRDLHSCHTTLAGRYVVEGHVPADIIERLVNERPEITGIAVAGMPIGSPGMEVSGMAPQPYSVIAFDAAGRRSVYARR